MKPILEPILYWLRLKKIKKYIPKNGRVCDIGCGRNGATLFRLEDLIKEGVGYDKKADPLKAGNIWLKKTEIFDKIAEQSDYFDCVIMLAVLEHLSQPDKILKECFRMLQSEGCVLITVPTPRAKTILDFLSFKIGIVSLEEIKDHKWYFSPQTLEEMLILAGFKKEKIFFKNFELGCNLFARALK